MAEEKCCDAWEKAHESCTDNEGYGALIFSSFDGEEHMGVDLPRVKFCPWCGAKKEKKNG